MPGKVLLDSYTQTEVPVLRLHFAHCPILRRGLLPKGQALGKSTPETDPVQLQCFLKTFSKVSKYILLPLKLNDSELLYAI